MVLLDLDNEQLTNPLPQLPLRTMLVIEADWWDTPVVFVANDKAGDPSRARGWPVFDGEEFVLIVRGVENDRVWSTDLRGWCNLKTRDPGWRVKEKDVMGGVVNPDEPGWTLERVLKRIEAKLLSLEVARNGS